MDIKLVVILKHSEDIGLSHPLLPVLILGADQTHELNPFGHQFIICAKSDTLSTIEYQNLCGLTQELDLMCDQNASLVGQVVENAPEIKILLSLSS